MTNKQTRAQTLEEPQVITGDMKPAKRQPHPNSLANLKPAKPGEVRNPNGRRPDQVLISPHMRRFAEMTFEEFSKLRPEKMTMGELMAWRMFLEASKQADEIETGNTKTRKELLDRIDGAVEKRQGDINVNVGVQTVFVDERKPTGY